MYLSDRDLRSLLPELAIAVEQGADAFDEETQIQPASIDLRLGSTFWEPLMRSPLDLRRAQLLEVEPRRFYRRKHLRRGQVITLRPGRLLLARTCESFAMPNGYAGELIGRSSFARLGLMVNASTGFINPGWKGHMPLQLVNLSPNALKLVPGLPICQLKTVRLTSEAGRVYGDESLQSKYINDDGGPSYWWRDKRIAKLQEMLGRVHLGHNVQQEVFRTIGAQEPEVIERLEKFVDRAHPGILENVHNLLDEFTRREEGRRARRKIAIGVSRALLSVPFATLLWTANVVLTRQALTTLHYLGL